MRRKLKERTAGAAVGGKVDRANSVIHGVKVLGPTSKNNRRYTSECIRAAVGMYAGKPVSVDHIGDDEQRSYGDRIGLLENPRLDGNSIRADLRVNPKHVLAEQLFWEAERSPGNLGLSHHVEGDAHNENGTMIVEKIFTVHGVDIVADPATTSGLYEAAGEATDADDSPAAEAAISAARAQAIGILNNDSLSTEEKIKQIRALLKSEEKARKVLADLDAKMNDIVNADPDSDTVEGWVRQLTGRMSKREYDRCLQTWTGGGDSGDSIRERTRRGGPQTAKEWVDAITE